MVVPCKCCPLRHHTLETKKKPTIYNQNNCLPHSLLPPHDRMANRSPPFNNIQFDFAVDISSFECNKHRYYNGKTRTVCYMLWPDGKYPTSTADYVWVDCFFSPFCHFSYCVLSSWIVTTYFVWISFCVRYHLNPFERDFFRSNRW